MTFSIVARTENTGGRARTDARTDAGLPEWGVAVASKFLAVGSLVPWARAGRGAIATQALANLSFGPDGLALLKSGADAATVVQQLTEADSDRDHRQLGVVDASGGAATFTGAECFDWAGGIAGDGYCCQGNILTGEDVVRDMATTFESKSGDLTDRLLAALKAGDDAGGDRRGKQSAAVYVVREGAAYGGTLDVAVDLRVDDHPDPVPELFRLLQLQRLYFPDENTLEFVPIDDEVAVELRDRLGVASGSGYDDAMRKALYAYMGTENLEERWSDEALIEVQVLQYIRDHT